jgi:hypothetical protein
MNDCDQRDLITGTAMPRVLAAVVGSDSIAPLCLRGGHVTSCWKRGFVAELGRPSLRDGARLGFRADSRIRKLPPLPVVRARGEESVGSAAEHRRWVRASAGPGWGDRLVGGERRSPRPSLKPVAAQYRTLDVPGRRRAGARNAV